MNEWIENLNEWAKKSLQKWIDNPKWNAERTDRGGRCLMGYSYVEAMFGMTFPRLSLKTSRLYSNYKRIFRKWESSTSVTRIS